MLSGLSFTIHLEDDNANQDEFDYSDHIAIVFNAGANYAEIETHTGSRHVECSLTLEELEEIAANLMRLVEKAKELGEKQLEREALES